MIFEDRYSAGEQLADLLVKYQNDKNAIILGLPRGGVVTASAVAQKLKVTLDVICPRKIGAPFNPELAIGAITETGEGVFNWSLINSLDISENYIKKEVEKEKQRAQLRLKIFRKGLPPRKLEGKTVILVDDGLATGATMKAAIQSVKAENAASIVVAIPVSPLETLQEIAANVDEVFCLDTPYNFQAVGQFYESFQQVEDEEVIRILEETHES